MNEYEAKQEAKRERLEDAATRKRREAETRFDAARRATAGIPFGQPILVGHHSESKHRNALKRHDTNMRKAIDAMDQAENLERRAESVGTGGVSADDPDALTKLRKKLTDLNARQVYMKAVNKTWREAGKPSPDSKHLDDWTYIRLKLNLSDKQLFKIIESMKLDMLVRAPFPPFKLSNNNAEIKRLERRIDDLESRRGQETVETDYGDFKIVENVEANRIQLFFSEKPDVDTRELMKSHGFRWARGVKAWQRQLTESARYDAQVIYRSLK